MGQFEATEARTRNAGPDSSLTIADAFGAPPPKPLESQRLAAARQGREGEVPPGDTIINNNNANRNEISATNNNANRNDNANSNANRNDNANNNANSNDNTNNNANRNDNANNNANRNDNTNNNANSNDNTNNSASSSRNDNNVANDVRTGNNSNVTNIKSSSVSAFATAPSFSGGECTTATSLGFSLGIPGTAIGLSGGQMRPDQKCLDQKELMQAAALVCTQSTNAALTAQSYDQQLLATGKELGTNPAAPSVAGRAEAGAIVNANSSMANGALCTEITARIAAKSGIELPKVEISGTTDWNKVAQEQALRKQQELQAAMPRPETVQQLVIVEQSQTHLPPARPHHGSHSAHRRPSTAHREEDCPPDGKKH